MNNYFNIHRFSNFVKRDLVLTYKTYLYLVGILFCFFIFCIFLYLYLGYPMTQLLLTGAGIMIAFSPFLLEKSKSRYRSVFDFTFPVSTLERFLEMVLKHVVILPALLLGTVYGFKMLGSIFPVEAIQDVAAYISFETVLNAKFIMGVTVTQSVFILGYLYFEKHILLKVILLNWLIGTVVMLVFVGILYGVIYMITGNGEFSGSWKDLEQIPFYHFARTDAGQSINKILKVLLVAILPVGFWTTAFFKLREKQI